MIIREFRPFDLRRVHEIEKMSFSEPYEIEILKQLFDMGSGFLVAQQKNLIVGYIIFWAIEEDQGHIISLAVDPKYKRLKVGSQLLKTTIDIFKNFNIFKISLEVKSQNKEAITFYKSLGFKCREKISNYYEDGSDAYKLYLNLL
ncbi:mycothiol acetyltransferase [Methanobrevibacter cuticularis]|uniref:Mycothiol acetyltransferase n=1 Tax=Methanobrevibacter cuticularis TaxID=47311 RepID=A0A166D4A5_9EURY|nr:ribosomal protein S18-alanine N-acetyltransferase [Methanobrevibacter cuticularis]KZX15192.1 mycothiol acetyltransferase [Methanobrevibacter cuticularis]